MININLGQGMYNIDKKHRVYKILLVVALMLNFANISYSQAPVQNNTIDSSRNSVDSSSNVNMPMDTVGTPVTAPNIDPNSVVDSSAQAKQDYTVPVVLTTKNMASISTEISGTIKQVLVRPGDYFKKDDVLLKFDCTLLDASMKKATAELNFAKNKNDSVTRLGKLDGASKMEMETSANEFAKAQTEFDIAKYNSDQCIQKAPFAGQMVELYIKEFETVKAGVKLYDIVDNSNFEIAMIVPSEWLDWLHKDDKFKLIIKENNKTYNGTISSIIYSVDAVSQSAKLIGKITDDTAGLFVGASGTATFEGPGNGSAK